jgi:signal transduction histidine kinase
MTRRLVVSYLALALVVLVALEIPLAVLLSSHVYSSTLDEAERDATSLAVVTVLEVEHARYYEVGSILHEYEVRTGSNVAIVGPSGNVIASSGEAITRDAVSSQLRIVRRALAGHSTSELTTLDGAQVVATSVPVLFSGYPDSAVLLVRSARGVGTRVHEIWLVLVLFGLVVLGLTGLVGVLLARSVSKPLARLELAVALLGNGTLEARASTVRGPEEVRSLGLQFNRMAERLGELVEAQRRFVADASHQLRSPLTALRLRLENLELVLEAPHRDDAAAAGHEVQRLSRIVDGLLTLPADGTPRPMPELIDVGTVITERCTAWSALAEERHVVLRTGLLPDRGPTASLVPGELDQILDNLLANALDACPDGSNVRIELVARSATQVELHVVDDGPGLALEERTRAFERFWQAADRRAGDRTGAGGAGLGLAIVRELAERNGVTVELRDSRPRGLDAVLTFGVDPPSTVTPGPAAPLRGALASEPTAAQTT